ncbi:MAG: hypothetical protein JWN79_1209 [Gemmatimonadetes bacterium]|nr:hypothetical protein [Gemmatimonadota bacterium]
MMSVARPRIALVALAFLAAACSDSPMQPVSPPVDLATALSEMSLSGIVPVSIGPSVSSLGPTLARCPYAAASQSFACAPLTSGGLTANSSFQLLTASGAPQSAFDQATTAAVRTTNSVTGSTTVGNDVMTIDEHGTMTLSGLLSGNHVLDGTQTAHITGTFSGFTMDETTLTTVSGVVPPIRGSGNPYPRAGTITMTVTDAASGGIPASTMVMALTFNGTSKVDLTITHGGTTQRCVIDLASGGTTGAGCFR